eukprot:1029571-Pyramimonas_sp.AAC.1
MTDCFNTASLKTSEFHWRANEGGVAGAFVSYDVGSAFGVHCHAPTPGQPFRIFEIFGKVLQT